MFTIQHFGQISDLPKATANIQQTQCLQKENLFNIDTVFWVFFGQMD